MCSEKEYALPNGHTLFVEDNKAGGRTYYSDEVGCGVLVWDTCLVAESTLLAAIHNENMLAFEEASIKRIDESRKPNKIITPPIVGHKTRPQLTIDLHHALDCN